MDLNTVEEIVRPRDRSALGAWEPGDAWLAGGTWLFSEPQPQLRRLVDLTAFGWPALEPGEGGLTIAATCTLTELSKFRGPAGWLAGPLFTQCCEALLGSFKVWNTATVGGNICLALPAGPMTALAVALDGVATVWSTAGDERSIAVADLVVGAGRTTLAAGDLLRSIELPVAALRCRTAHRQVSLTNLGRSAVLVIGRRSPDDDSTVFTITAATVRPVQLRFAGPPTADELSAALEAAGPAYHDDVHGDPRWRRALTATSLESVRRELAEPA
jgi:CO/xanthine dehydrogenase FAD-binding subunit